MLTGVLGVVVEQKSEPFEGLGVDMARDRLASLHPQRSMGQQMSLPLSIANWASLSHYRKARSTTECKSHILLALPCLAAPVKSMLLTEARRLRLPPLDFPF